MKEWGENLFSLALERRGQGEGEIFLFLLIFLSQKTKWKSRQIDKLIKNKGNNLDK